MANRLGPSLSQESISEDLVYYYIKNILHYLIGKIGRKVSTLESRLKKRELSIEKMERPVASKTPIQEMEKARPN